MTAARNSLTLGLRIDNWTVEPALNRMSRDSEIVLVEPKVMAVLVYLAERPGTLVTRQELEATVWSGVVVGYDALTGAIQKLRKARPSATIHITHTSSKLFPKKAIG